MRTGMFSVSTSVQNSKTGMPGDAAPPRWRAASDRKTFSLQVSTTSSPGAAICGVARARRSSTREDENASQMPKQIPQRADVRVDGRAAVLSEADRVVRARGAAAAVGAAHAGCSSRAARRSGWDLPVSAGGSALGFRHVGQGASHRTPLSSRSRCKKPARSRAGQQPDVLPEQRRRQLRCRTPPRATAEQQFRGLRAPSARPRHGTLPAALRPPRPRLVGQHAAAGAQGLVGARAAPFSTLLTLPSSLAPEHIRQFFGGIGTSGVRQVRAGGHRSRRCRQGDELNRRKCKRREVRAKLELSSDGGAGSADNSSHGSDACTQAFALSFDVLAVHPIELRLVEHGVLFS